MSKQIVVQKAAQVEEIRKLLTEYKALGIANLQKVRAAQLQEMKKKLQDMAHVRVIKNTLMRRAVAESKSKPGLEKLEPMLSGSNIFLFTNLNPFKLSLLLEKGRVRTTAKAGDVAAIDVLVPAGNTGQPPGPVISQLGAVGLPTRIEAGSVWINKDTMVAKKGDLIDARLAGVLSKLGIKPVEVGLNLKAVYEDGFIITDEQLHIDVDGFRKSLIEAASRALNLSLNAAYPTLETMSLLLQTAHRRAFNLAINAGVLTKETIGDLLRKAHAEASALNAKLPKAEEKPSSEPSTQKG
ncbi:MAG TPA: 50S ribosomal protein L10 [Candidatus Bathyarchaeia archaeon]|nr:50S ribosomal protein L10 [Candidatus Bathyarchaeia archaeon]